MKPVFVGGITSPSTEELLAHVELVPPDEDSGATTYEFLQQYLMELDENGRSMYTCVRVILFPLRF